VVVKVALDVSAMPVKLAGAGRYVDALAHQLGGEVDLTLVSRRHDRERWLSVPEARVVSPVPAHPALRLAYEAYRLGTTAPARRADVWHGPHYTMPRTGRTPVVVTIHDLTFFTHPEWHEARKVSFFTRAIRYAAEHAAALVCVSETTRDELRDLVPTSRPVFVAPHGVDFSRFSRVDTGDEERLASATLPMATPYVLFVGTVEPRKGLDILLAAFAEVASDNPTVELWIAGQSGWGDDPVAASLLSHPFASRIRRLGFVADDLLPTLYRRASVVAYPSRGEGFGLPVLEALACGAAVVTSADTVMAEVAGTAARLVPVGDVEGLANALEAALALSPAERDHHGEEASRHASRFTWGASLAVHRTAYEVAMAP
jgi:glycosyltransferase involved in cell wall biosynthesis